MAIMYDSELAIAELKRFTLIMEHHFRHIERNKDVVTAKVFETILGAMSAKASVVHLDCKRYKKAMECGLCAKLKGRHLELYGFRDIGQLHAAHYKLERMSLELDETLTFEVLERKLYEKRL